jgi:hypothetical protein
MDAHGREGPAAAVGLDPDADPGRERSGEVVERGDPGRPDRVGAVLVAHVRPEVGLELRQRRLERLGAGEDLHARPAAGERGGLERRGPLGDEEARAGGERPQEVVGEAGQPQDADADREARGRIPRDRAPDEGHTGGGADRRARVVDPDHRGRVLGRPGGRGGERGAGAEGGGGGEDGELSPAHATAAFLIRGRRGSR